MGSAFSSALQSGWNLAQQVGTNLGQAYSSVTSAAASAPMRVVNAASAVYHWGTSVVDKHRAQITGIIAGLASVGFEVVSASCARKDGHYIGHCWPLGWNLNVEPRYHLCIVRYGCELTDPDHLSTGSFLFNNGGGDPETSGEQAGARATDEDAGFRGGPWKLGDPIDKPSATGKAPTWDTMRSRYWKNRALDPNAVELYGADNVELMKRGQAPRRPNPDAPGGVESMELSHESVPQREGGTTDVVERWPCEHAAVDPFRRPGYC